MYLDSIWSYVLWVVGNTAEMVYEDIVNMTVSVFMLYMMFGNMAETWHIMFLLLIFKLFRAYKNRAQQVN